MVRAMRLAPTPPLGQRDTLHPVSQHPRVWIADGFVDAAECASLLAALPVEGSADARAYDAVHDDTGLSFEWPVDAHPLAASLATRLTALLGLPNSQGSTLRFRRYATGESHPLHPDTYAIDGENLVLTAMLVLDEARGGETHFPDAEGGPLLVAPAAGRLVAWMNHRPDGAADPRAVHEALPVLDGTKTTLTWFVYAPLAAAAHTPGTGPWTPPPHRPGTRFFCVNNHVPADTIRFLRDACTARGVSFREVETDDFDFSAPTPLRPGDLLYRPAVAYASIKVEQHLFTDGVATLHGEPDGVFFDSGASLALFERAGVPVPRSIYLHTTRRDRLRAYVDALGGFPVLAKFPGTSGGNGVVRLDSMQALFSFVDFALERGPRPSLTSFVPDAVHWRLVVVGDRVVAAYVNPPRVDDFRTHSSDDVSDYRIPDDPELLETAIHAVRALRVEFGGVDVLVHPSGRCYVLESNFPCYFGAAQGVGGFDVAGAIVDHLKAKALALAGA